MSFCELKTAPFTKSESGTIFFVFAQKSGSALKKKKKWEFVVKYMEPLNQMAPLANITTSH